MRKLLIPWWFANFDFYIPSGGFSFLTRGSICFCLKSCLMLLFPVLCGLHGCYFRAKASINILVVSTWEDYNCALQPRFLQPGLGLETCNPSQHEHTTSIVTHYVGESLFLNCTATSRWYTAYRWVPWQLLCLLVLRFVTFMLVLHQSVKPRIQPALCISFALEKKGLINSDSKFDISQCQPHDPHTMYPALTCQRRHNKAGSARS